MYLCEKEHSCPHPKTKGTNLVHCDDPRHKNRSRCNRKGRKMIPELISVIFGSNQPAHSLSICDACRVHRYRNVKNETVPKSQKIKLNSVKSCDEIHRNWKRVRRESPLDSSKNLRM